MTSAQRARHAGGQWGAICAAAIVAALAFTTPGRNAWRAFFGSLRIAKPQPVTVNVTPVAGASGNRQLQDAIGGMIGGQVTVGPDEQDQPVASVDAAVTLAGFTPRLPRSRTDAPTIVVTGARDVRMTLNPPQLRTILAEAGQPTTVPAALNGTVLTLHSPRAIRAQYGNCPVPAANTLVNQINGPPPTSPENANCIVLHETPATVTGVPAGLDLDQLVAIALELAGMSPAQQQSFRQTFDTPAILSMSLPRFMRSYDAVDVAGARGMLLNAGGRRGPTYVLLWVRNGMVYSLTGYGNSTDAVPLAASVN
jgi:hypothetical protein